MVWMLIKKVNYNKIKGSSFPTTLDNPTRIVSPMPWEMSFKEAMALLDKGVSFLGNVRLINSFISLGDIIFLELSSLLFLQILVGL